MNSWKYKGVVLFVGVNRDIIQFAPTGDVDDGYFWLTGDIPDWVERGMIVSAHGVFDSTGMPHFHTLRDWTPPHQPTLLTEAAITHSSTEYPPPDESEVASHR